MNQLPLLAMCFVYSLKSFAYQLLQSFPHIMKYSNRLWKQIYNFVYYKISEVIKTCFERVTRHKIIQYGNPWKEKYQLIIPGLKKMVGCELCQSA